MSRVLSDDTFAVSVFKILQNTVQTHGHVVNPPLYHQIKPAAILGTTVSKHTQAGQVVENHQYTKGDECNENDDSV